MGFFRITFYIISYTMLIGFLLIERFLRKGSKDRSRTESDKSSTAFISVVMGISFIFLIFSPLLDYLEIGKIEDMWIGIIGIFFGVVGIIFRCVAFNTLGRFFTRTICPQVTHFFNEKYFD